MVFSGDAVRLADGGESVVPFVYGPLPRVGF